MSSNQNRRVERGAAFVAVVAGITLVTRLILRTRQSDGVLDALSYMSQYFTILTNTIVFLMMLAIAMGRYFSPAIIRAVVVSIACVGLLYHSLLAHLVSLSGLDLLADHGTHTIVPVLSVIWWLFCGENPRLTWRDPFLWIFWPLLYTGYILLRASSSGSYPYPFLNLPDIGSQQLLVNTIVISSGFIFVGGVMFGLAYLIRRDR